MDDHFTYCTKFGATLHFRSVLTGFIYVNPNFKEMILINLRSARILSQNSISVLRTVRNELVFSLRQNSYQFAIIRILGSINNKQILPTIALPCP